MKIEIVHDYINREKMENALLELLKEEMENFGDKNDEIMNEVKENLSDDDFYELREYVENLADSFNSSMRKYVHQKDTSIWGNFNDIRDDYYRGGVGVEKCPVSETINFDDIIKIIDEGKRWNFTEEFLDWVNDWFFATFGTWGICYNFGDYLDFLYEELEYERETIEA